MSFLDGLLPEAATTRAALLVLDLSIKVSLLVWLASLLDRWLGTSTRATAAARHRVLDIAYAGATLLAVSSPFLLARPLPLLGSLTASTETALLETVHDATAPGAELELAGQPPIVVGSSAAPGRGAFTADTPAGSRSPLMLGLLVVLVAWGLGASARVARFGLALLRASRLARRADRLTSGPWPQCVRRLRERVGIRRPIELRVHEDVATPMTLGVLRPVVLLPADAPTWSGERRDMVLLHELAHVARFDQVGNVLVGLACALFWHLPWVERTRLRWQERREEACDDCVVVNGESATVYAHELVELARGLAPQPRLAGIAPCLARGELEHRLHSILDARKRRKRPSAPGLTLLSALLLVGPLATVRLDGAPATTLTTGTATELLASPVAAERARAVAFLGQERESRYFERLVSLRADDSPEVRIAVIDALAGIGCDPAFLSITDSLRDADPAVRAHACRAVASFGVVMPHWSRTRVWGMLPRDYRTLLERVGVAGSADTTVERLEALLDDADERVQAAARDRLQRLGRQRT